MGAGVGEEQKCKITNTGNYIIHVYNKPPSNFYCWPSQGGSSVLFFGDFRCGGLLFMVIHVIYKYKNR